MAKASTPTSRKATSRDEKLSVLSALLGPEAIAKLRGGDATGEQAPIGAEVDADRAAWHRNKLLERLRGKTLGLPQESRGPTHPPTMAEPLGPSAPVTNRGEATSSANTSKPRLHDGSGAQADRPLAGFPNRLSERPKSSDFRTADLRAPEAKRSGLDANLAAMASHGSLEQEHPAVIARLMKSLSREERIVAIKSLPGPVARSILHRLR